MGLLGLAQQLVKQLSLVQFLIGFVLLVGGNQGLVVLRELVD